VQRYTDILKKGVIKMRGVRLTTKEEREKIAGEMKARIKGHIEGRGTDKFARESKKRVEDFCKRFR